ncbi:MAG TPA: hypothetical protein VFE58_06380 [Tepidisphaeraceae bacterium]|jgi:hypothetical protein|nr:hypothetical protein [Tepidisphaeraceae bacterium]
MVQSELEFERLQFARGIVRFYGLGGNRGKGNTEPIMRITAEARIAAVQAVVGRRMKKEI